MNDWTTQRKSLQLALNKLEQFEGRFLSKISEQDRETIKNTIQTHDLMPQQVQGYSKTNAKYINLSGLRNSIEIAEAKIHKIDTLESCPELAEARELINRLGEIETKMREDTGITDPLGEANKLRLIGGFVQRYA